MAYDAQTGAEAWKFYTIPGPGEPGHDTWSDDDWEHGGASVWITGSYDADTDQAKCRSQIADENSSST